MSNKLQISVSPHIRCPRTTQSIMLDVVIALLPAAIAGIVIFGMRAALVLGACVLTTVLSELLFNLAVKKKQTVGDLSAVVTGLLLGLNLSANVPIWQAVVGSIFAIVVVKCLFGGIGRNFVNPAITARVFMLVAFTSVGSSALPVNYVPVDGVSSATPLSVLANNAEELQLSLADLFLGNYGGAIGETCTLALLIGFAYLLVRRVITWHIPAVFVGSAYIFTLMFNGFDPVNALTWILSGGLFIGAIFMATDYATSPATPWGKVVFALGAGALTVLIRFFGSYPEGASFAILLMNILTPYIEVWTARKPFGGKIK